MTRLQQVVLWTVAVFVFGYVGFRFLIMQASTIALAQSPAVNQPATATNFDSPAVAQQQQPNLTGAQSDGASVHQADPILDDKPSPASLPEPAVDGPIVSYRFKTPDFQNDVLKLKEQYARRANIDLDSHSNNAGVPTIIVRAPAAVQDEIRAVIHYLTKQRPLPASAPGQPQPMSPAVNQADMALSNKGEPQERTFAQQSIQFDYLGLRSVAQQAAQDRIQAARNQLSTSTTDEDRAVARAQLRQLLTEVFSQDMQARQNQAKDIETRLAKLQKQYQDREQSRDKIIDLQLQVLEQDAAGLGFPQTQSAQPGKSSDAIHQRTLPSPARLQPARLHPAR